VAINKVSKNGRYDDNRDAGFDRTFDNTASRNVTTLGQSVALNSISPQGLILGPLLLEECYFSVQHLVRPANAI
jgi:hypothetical protein